MPRSAVTVSLRGRRTSPSSPANVPERRRRRKDLWTPRSSTTVAMVDVPRGSGPAVVAEAQAEEEGGERAEQQRGERGEPGVRRPGAGDVEQGARGEPAEEAAGHG